MTDFAPGPWTYRPTEYHDWGTVEVNGFTLCQIRDPRYMADDYHSQCRKDKRDPWEANAHLIAAAPEMYEALMGQISRLDALRAFYVTSVGPDYIEVKKLGDEITSIRAVLTKAGGKT